MNDITFMPPKAMGGEDVMFSLCL